jgi:hypothetical protein
MMALGIAVLVVVTLELYDYLKRPKPFKIVQYERSFETLCLPEFRDYFIDKGDDCG